MEGYLAGFKDTALNKILSAGYQSKEVRAKLHGDKVINFMGAQVDILWDVSKEPVANFYDIDPRWPPMDESGQPLVLNDNMFFIETAIKLSVNGEQAEPTELPMAFIASPLLNTDGSVAFKIVGLQVDGSYTDTDKVIIRGLCGDIIGAINTALGFDAGNTPSIISFAFLKDLGLDYTPAGIRNRNGTMEVWAGDGTDFMFANIPEDKDLALIVTDNAYAKIITQYLEKNRSPIWTGKKFKYDYGGLVGEVKGSFCYRVSRLWCERVDDEIVYIRANTDAKLGVSVWLGSYDYDAYTNPSDLQTSAIVRLEDGCLKGRTEEMDSFTVSLTPRSSSWIASAIKSTLEKYVNDEVDSMRKDLRYDINIPIPEKTIPTGITSLQVKLTNYSDFALCDMQHFYANLDVTIVQ